MSGDKIVLYKHGMLIVRKGRRQCLLSQNKQVKFRIRSFFWVGFPLSRIMHVLFIYLLMGDSLTLLVYVNSWWVWVCLLRWTGEPVQGGLGVRCVCSRKGFTSLLSRKTKLPRTSHFLTMWTLAVTKFFVLKLNQLIAGLTSLIQKY